MQYDVDMSRALELSTLSEQEAFDLALKESAASLYGDINSKQSSSSSGSAVSFAAEAKPYSGVKYILYF